MKHLPTILPVLLTGQLRLRALAESDTEALFGIYRDERVMRTTSDPTFESPRQVAQMLQSVARLLEQGRSLEWGVEILATGELVGTCGLHTFDAARSSAQVGCILAHRAWGRGYMREALQAVIAYARQPLFVEILEAEIDEPNLRSHALFKRLGFLHVSGNLHVLRLVSG